MTTFMKKGSFLKKIPPKEKHDHMPKKKKRNGSPIEQINNFWGLRHASTKAASKKKLRKGHPGGLFEKIVHFLENS